MIWSGSLDANVLARLPRIKAMGYASVELPIFDPSAIDVATLRVALADAGLACTACTSFPEGFNLLDAAPERFGLFDLIFCRNVFIYFDAATKAEIVAKLIASLAPGGYLFLGHAEGLHGTDPRVRCVAPSVYRLQPPAGLKGSRNQ